MKRFVLAVVAVVVVSLVAACDNGGDWNDDEECDDGIPCTEDAITGTFTPAGGGPPQYNCANIPRDDRCDDGDVCTRVGCEPG